MRRARVLSAVGGAILLALAATPAQASPDIPSGTDQCDSSVDHLGDWYSLTDEKSHHGRNIELHTGSVRDAYAVSRIEDVERGDKLWIDRSFGKFEMKTGEGGTHPSNADVERTGGWKQCGPFTATWLDDLAGWAVTDGVYLQASDTHSYAVRACMRPADSDDSECTDWFVDHL
ncbi:hypothetical protein H1V43_08100 [Streptomyces sp. PSKA54]|uniref:Secreted protein n=1 Tax=Streptomyces himalayensis subsp. aureolus TaxID=2758039 RepID=A0A7W2CY91_9ACTN|nr:hypothetical protein [Streptomyces himalayensis]MBA4861350.1 hypothetical protein [Streptomyces himalayensis subsp. aureolus]